MKALERPIVAQQLSGGETVHAVICVLFRNTFLVRNSCNILDPKLSFWQIYLGR